MTLERFCPRSAPIDRRAALAWLSTFATGSPAQRASRVPRVAYFSSRPGPNDFEEAFLRGMRELGWIDARNIVFDFRWFNFDPERGKTLVTEAMAARPDLAMLADSTGVRPLIKSLMPALPIVLPAMADPVAQGITSNLARPDSNMTGISVFSTELSHKRLSLLKEALPSMRRAGALFNKNRLGGPPTGVNATLQAGKELGVEVIELPVDLPYGIDAAFAEAKRQGLQGTAIVSDTATITHREPLCALSAAHGMPTIFANRAYLRTGGLMSYGPDIAGAFYRAAYYVDRILKGAKPSELPIEQPNTFQLTLNLRTARAINLQFPQSLLLRADETVQ